MIFRVLVALRPVSKWAYRQRGLGVARLAERIRVAASRRAPAEPMLIHDFGGANRFECHLREHMGSQIFFRGSYSTEQLAVLDTFLEPDSVFVDAGANQGEFTVFAAGRLSSGRVVAVEPVGIHRQRLLRNVEVNGFDNVVLCEVALGDTPGRLPIYDSDELFHDGTLNEGLPTLYPRSSIRTEREVVDVRRLDDLLEELAIGRVAVVKMDIEGGELAALRGATRLIERDRPVILLEIGRATCEAAGYAPEELAAWLRDRGYALSRIGHGGALARIDEMDDFQNVVAVPSGR